MRVPGETLDEEFERLGLHPFDPAGDVGLAEEMEPGWRDPDAIYAEDELVLGPEEVPIRDIAPVRVEPGLTLADFYPREFDPEVIDAQAEIDYGYYLDQLREQEERDRRG